MSARQAALIWCPFADEASAANAAEIMLDEALVACVNILPPMRALYIWKAQRGDARETGALFKTDKLRLERAVVRLSQIHPYDNPAITGWLCDAASPATLEWLSDTASGIKP